MKVDSSQIANVGFGAAAALIAPNARVAPSYDRDGQTTVSTEHMRHADQIGDPSEINPSHPILAALPLAA